MDNILCQVEGSKYVRLYPPDQKHKLYPRKASLNNTSQVDVESVSESGSRAHTHQQFPLFPTASYQELILRQGESLFIPKGYWHFVKALTKSISVNFWFEATRASCSPYEQ
uniref:JmjC domain-containing protein n=2 Tax=Amorphochlora amoebiformis TaxID=1561963 RepID=A0A7S0DJT6_9EUKA|mmetsp:Transcript_27797/g.44211  ORF Transcript_27797/g.44211 Transcript_27797/m.44211 type:complete len:111 (+) Transcript_27797:194-526(+)